MTLSRITTTFGAAVLGVVLVASTHGSQAAGMTAHHARPVVHQRFVAPMPHKYLPNGLRMGLHCDSDMGPGM